MEGYSAKIVNSSRPLTVRERIMMKNTTDATQINAALKNGSVDFSPVLWADVEIHNERSENKDYSTLVVLASDGMKYYTSSPSFKEAFIDIFSEMVSENGEAEEFWVRAYTLPSKNQQGCFITCSIL